MCRFGAKRQLATAFKPLLGASRAEVHKEHVMSAPARNTAVVFGRLQSRELRLAAARNRVDGLQVMTVEQLACRLAGGFCRPIDDEALRKALQSALEETPLGELEEI